MSPQAIERVLAEFRLWLEAVAGLESFGPPANGDEVAGAPVDLATLVGQFVALRHEVNLQTRASRGQMEQNAQALEQFSHSLAELQRRQALGEEKSDATAQQDEATRPLLKSLLDAHDSLNLAQREVQRIKDALERLTQRPVDAPPEVAADSSPFGRIRVHVPWWLRLLGLGDSAQRSLATLQSRWEDAQAQDLDKQRAYALHLEKRAERIQGLSERIQQSVQSILTGYGMSLQRLERMLEQHGLEPIDAVGELFDPEQMEALEVVIDPTRPSGEVVEEVRRGYLWHGKVFRFAQVKVARS